MDMTLQKIIDKISLVAQFSMDKDEANEAKEMVSHLVEVQGQLKRCQERASNLKNHEKPKIIPRNSRNAGADL